MGSKELNFTKEYSLARVFGRTAVEVQYVDSRENGEMAPCHNIFLTNAYV